MHPIFIFLYLRGESNPYLKFRKLLFYPLNYRGFSLIRRWQL